MPLRRDGRSFVAHKVIMPGPDVELDMSWKDRYENDLRAWKKRKELEKKVAGFFESRFWKRLRLCGLATLMAILVAAMLFVYSEKKLLSRDQGMFDGFKKKENPF